MLLAILLVHAGLLAWTAWRHSPTWDEFGHLVAGISHWEFGTFDLYRVNPPLVRSVAAIPMLYARPLTDWRAYDALPGARSEREVREQFTIANGPAIFWLHTLARWACIPFSLLGAYVCFRWASDLYGGASGLVAACLWCFSPNILAHGHLMTPDVGAAALGAAAAYLFWRWLRRPGWLEAILGLFVRGYAAPWRDELVLLLPAVAVLALVSSQTGLALRARSVRPPWSTQMGPPQLGASRLFPTGAMAARRARC